MSKKASAFFPKYQLRHRQDPKLGSREIFFPYAEVDFTTRVPFFGITETQKTALRWAACNKTPPVICVTHYAPVAPDKKQFRDPDEHHRMYYPYAMALAILECLGEDTLRKLKIYYCNVELREENELWCSHSRCKNTYIIPF